MQEYKNEKLIVRYGPGICIHAGACVRGLSSVFNDFFLGLSRILPSGQSPRHAAQEHRPQLERCGPGRAPSSLQMILFCSMSRG